MFLTTVSLFATVAVAATLTGAGNVTGSFDVQPFTIDLSGGIPHLMDLANRTRLPSKALYFDAGLYKGLELDYLPESGNITLLLALTAADDSQAGMIQPCWNCRAPAAFLDLPPTPEHAHDFTRLRTGNEVPLDSEIPLVRDVISSAEDRLNTLETQIRNLEVALSTLVQRRDETRQELHEHRAILHPVRRVPSELVCDIFALTLDDPDDPDDPDAAFHAFGYTPPWYLGQISRSWRHWAVAYPRLWNYITIPSSAPPSGDCLAFDELLLRSGDAPLNVYWVVAQDRCPVEPQVAEIALAHCGRWAILRLNIRHASDGLDWLLPAKGCLPALKTLAVLHGPSVAIPDIFSIAPSLREVLFTDWDFSYYSSNVQIPWSQITHYRGSYREPDQLEVLRAASNLEQCALSFETPYYEFQTHFSAAPIELSHLRRLHIERPRYLRHLRAPSLEVLHCKYMREEDIHALLSFIHASHCPLQKLVLMSCDILPELITALRSLPSLTYLLIEADAAPEEENDLFREMTISNSPRDLCPNLISLVYSCGYNSSVPHELLFSMARSRLLHGGLNTFRVFDPLDGTEVAEAARKLRGEGYDADVLTSNEFERLTGKGSF
ncbi:hypothetical protein C8R47DRAFT_1216349 [Mycena vitilis]|nr:hypothetical protein C8R47DRAFT_1216349 [Mycena vitilis]